MTTYADEIDEANDSTVRKAHVEALFGDTKLAALMAATDGGKRPQTEGERNTDRDVRAEQGMRSAWRPA